MINNQRINQARQADENIREVHVQKKQLNFSNEIKQSQILEQFQTQNCITQSNRLSQESTRKIHKKQQSRSILKRQVLRIVFIPLLIILILLIIALTFKQNTYQTNDYFYSKNIEINRKIRGIVPPLNQTRDYIFGQYRIGLFEKFGINDRRMFQKFKVQIFDNYFMRVEELEKERNCWSMYRMKFYSSTLFIQKFEEHLMKNTAGKTSADLDIGSNNYNTQNNAQLNQFQSQTQQTVSNQQVPEVKKQIISCSLDLWSSLNKILYESHIWTFSELNFYLLEFSQTNDQGNGVLIMNMLSKFQNV